MSGEHETILRLIEECDPGDTARMDEIDARVWAFLNLIGDFKISFSGGAVYYRHKTWPMDAHTVLHHSFSHPQYTRSRDGLKAIRPEGWYFQTSPIEWKGPKAGFMCKTNIYSEYYEERLEETLLSVCRTEELAELHAIIQAIAYELALAEPV
jgi:hypothetical protein